MNINDLDPDNSTYLNIKTFNQYLEANPELKSIAISRVVKNGIAILRRCIEEPKDNGVNWEHPYVQLNYSVTKESRLTELPLITRHTNASFIDFQSIMFASVTDHIAYIYELDKDKDSYLVYLKEDSEEFKKLTPNRQQKIKEKLFKKYENPKRKPTFTLPLSLVLKDTKGKQKGAIGSLIINFLPLFIDEANDEAYYPLIIGLDITTGYKPTYWSDEDKKGFWEYIDKTFKDISPQESFEFLDKLGEPEVKPVQKGTNLIKIPMHLEKQKIGRRPKPSQDSIFDSLDKKDKEKVEKYNIKIVGVDFTVSQNKALFTLQTLLNKTDQRGVSYKEAPTNSFDYQGYIPTLNFTISEYLDAYGVNKRESTRRKIEYNSNEREEALKALRSLSENRYLLYYSKTYFNKEINETRYKLIITPKPLITISEGYDNLTKTEHNTLTEGKETPETNKKLTRLAVELSPIFVDQIENHYVLKPANIYEELKIKAPRASKFTYRFIDYLFTTVAQRNSKYKRNKNWIIEINYLKLARDLKMESWIKSRNWKQIRGSLDKCYDIAKELGYLISYNTITGKTVKEMERLALNPDKFYRAEEIKETREKMEKEAII